MMYKPRWFISGNEGGRWVVFAVGVAPWMVYLALVAPSVGTVWVSMCGWKMQAKWEPW